MKYETMPFGKYKGTKIEDLPTTYLTYALVSFELPDELKESIFTQLMHDVGGWDYVDTSDDVDARIKDAYYSLCLKYHPDKGGTKEAMQALNEFKDALS